MTKQKKWNVWVSGSFYMLEIYATSYKEMRKLCKENYGKYPYHTEMENKKPQQFHQALSIWE
jgi:hypothetical protein